MATDAWLGHQHRQLTHTGLVAGEARQVIRRHDGPGRGPHRPMLREVDSHTAILPPGPPPPGRHSTGRGRTQSSIQPSASCGSPGAESSTNPSPVDGQPPPRHQPPRPDPVTPDPGLCCAIGGRCSRSGRTMDFGPSSNLSVSGARVSFRELPMKRCGWFTRSVRGWSACVGRWVVWRGAPTARSSAGVIDPWGAPNERGLMPGGAPAGGSAA